MGDHPRRLVPAETLRRLMERLLEAAGCPGDTAATAAGVFLEADLRGMDVQGLDHLPTLLDDLRLGNVDPKARPEVVKDGPAFALLDGHLGPGQVTAVLAADIAIRKAKRAGCAAVGIVNGADPYMIGYYVDRIARAGLIGMMFQGSGPLVHPHGGSEAVMGTNPLAIGIPTAGADPIVLDMATSALSHSRVRQARYHGELLPEGSGFDADGLPTREASRIETGAIAPLGGHKGFGLSLCVGLLCGPLVGAAVGKALMGWLGQGGETGSMGQLFLAIDPAMFGDGALFRARVSAHLAELKASRKAPGVEAIRIPGERSFAHRAQALERGVPILEACWQNTAKHAAELGVAMPG